MKLANQIIVFTLLAIAFLTIVSYSQAEDIVKLNIQNPAVEVQRGKEFTVGLTAVINSSWHINSNKPNDEFLIPTVVSAKGNGIKLVKVRYPKPLELKFSFSDSPVSVFEGETKIGLTFEVLESATAGKRIVEVILDYQACNDVTCLPPNSVSSKFEVVIIEKSAVTQKDEAPQDTSSASDKEKDVSLEEIKNQYLSSQSQSADTKQDDSGSVASTLENSGLLLSLVFIFLAGLALNLTPCVYPLIPITIGYFGGQAEGKTSRLFLLGVLYVLGMAITYSVIGVVTALSGAVFGALLQNPFVIIGIVILFVVLALGLGFPYLLLAIFTGKIKNLPRAGAWMEGVKHIFGFLLIGLALYFLDPILPKSIQGYSLPIFGLVTAIILLFVDKTANNAKGFRIFKTIFSLIVLAISVYVLVPKENLEPEWQKFSLQAYESSLKNNEKIVVDFYADWCIPCKELDALTFSDGRVLKEMENFTNYKIDMTKMTPENENLRKRFKVVGMPTVLIIDSNGKEINRITGFVNADEFLSNLEGL